MKKGQKITNAKTIAALKLLSKRHGGLLQPEIVVDAARPVSSPLHAYFTWDDTEAANKCRIEEARRLLQITVEYIKNGKEEVAYRVFCSLTSDRKDGGYRVTANVMSNADLRAQLLEDARAEMKMFERKYHMLKELAVVFAAIRKALE
jgi:hypothetical protein